jgi:hypothetical protein
MEKNKYLLQAARDTLMSQLGLAAPVPLADLPVRAIEPVVVHGNQAQLEIAYSQLGISYELRTAEGRAIGSAQVGDGGPLQLKTSALEDDEYAFAIQAVRTPASGLHLAGPLEARLLQTVFVQVRTDTELAVSLQALRIAYGAPAEVWVRSAQSRTRYELVNEKKEPLSAAVETRVAGDVQLWTRALTEDTTIAVRATNIKKDLSDLLKQQVDVVVGPRLDVAATFTPAVVGYNGEATIRLVETQKTASYQLIISEAGGAAQPQELLAKVGTGGDLTLSTGPLQEDCTVGIKVKKMISGLTGVLAVQLTIPVRPNPKKQLLLVAALTEAGKSTVVTSVATGTRAVIKVDEPQSGVYYQLRVGTSPAGMPAYYHVNAKIGQARVGVEFVIDAFNAAAVYLPTDVLTETTEFTVFAFKPTREAEGIELGYPHPIKVTVKVDPA